jgi:hypothetical protein
MSRCGTVRRGEAFQGYSFGGQVKDQIPTFESIEAAYAAGNTIRITDAEARQLRRMTRTQKRVWAAAKKREVNFKPRVVPHTAARVAGETLEDHRATRNAAKRERKARRS